MSLRSVLCVRLLSLLAVPVTWALGNQASLRLCVLSAITLCFFLTIALCKPAQRLDAELDRSPTADSDGKVVQRQRRHVEQTDADFLGASRCVTVDCLEQVDEQCRIDPAAGEPDVTGKVNLVGDLLARLRDSKHGRSMSKCFRELPAQGWPAKKMVLADEDMQEDALCLPFAPGPHVLNEGEIGGHADIRSVRKKRCLLNELQQRPLDALDLKMDCEHGRGHAQKPDDIAKLDARLLHCGREQKHRRDGLHAERLPCLSHDTRRIGRRGGRRLHVGAEAEVGGEDWRR